MKNLDSKNILKLIDALYINNSYYLILEYCNEGNLYNYIHSNIYKYNHSYMHQILNGLHYLYDSNIYIEI